MNTHDFINKMQRKKTELYLKEEELKKKAIKEEHPDNSQEIESNKAKVLKKNPAKFTDVEPKKVEKSGTKDGNSKLNVDPSSADGLPDNFKPKCNVSKLESKKQNESIFILAGIEDLLADPKMSQGASKAIDMINNYSGGKIDPQIQQYIDAFKNSLNRPATEDKGNQSAETGKGKVMKNWKADNTDVNPGK